MSREGGEEEGYANLPSRLAEFWRPVALKSKVSRRTLARMEIEFPADQCVSKSCPPGPTLGHQDILNAKPGNHSKDNHLITSDLSDDEQYHYKITSDSSDPLGKQIAEITQSLVIWQKNHSELTQITSDLESQITQPYHWGGRE